jgi:subtilisin family serine protease
VCIKATWKGIKKGRPGHRKIVPWYKTISGTSLASPHVAGAAAVYVANQTPRPTPAQVRTFVTGSGEHRGRRQRSRRHFNFYLEPVLQMDTY